MKKIEDCKKDNAVMQAAVTPSMIGFCQILYSREEHLLHIFENGDVLLPTLIILN